MKNTQDENGGSRSVDHIVRQLPSEEGFYWWRENPERTWRMVQVVDFASGVEDKARLMTYDVQNYSWSGRSLKGWADHFPIGEWLHVPMPNDQDEGQPEKGASHVE
jgi:hypothetical protein